MKLGFWIPNACGRGGGGKAPPEQETGGWWGRSVSLQPDGQGKGGRMPGGLLEVGQGVWWLVVISQLCLISIIHPLRPWILGVAVICYFPGSCGRGSHEPVPVLLLTWAAGKGRDMPTPPPVCLILGNKPQVSVLDFSKHRYLACEALIHGHQLVMLAGHG